MGPTANDSLKQPEIEVPPGHAHHGRQEFPAKPHHRRLPLRCPSAATVWSLVQSAFVDEDEGLVEPGSVVFDAGKRRFFQRRVASSSRSTERRTGRWQLQSNCFNSRQTWVELYRTPHSCSINCATCWLVHRLVAYPTSGPRLSPLSICCRSAADNFGFRPARPLLFNPARPASFSCRVQRLTDWRWTPTRRATSDWWTPFQVSGPPSGGVTRGS